MRSINSYSFHKAFKVIEPAVLNAGKRGKTFLINNYGKVLGVFAGFAIAYALYLYMSASRPTISLQFPGPDQIVSGDKLYVSGVVKPVGSKVIVNGKKVSQNGDGSFTAVVTLADEGKSNLKIEATYRSKKSELTLPVVRELTEEEKKKRDDEKKLADIKNREKVLGIDQRIDELVAAYDNERGENFIKVLSHELIQEMNFKRVEGEVVNAGQTKAYWVRVTATFYNENSEVVDTKVGFVVALDKALNPGEKGKFDTQSTTKEFIYYKLTLDWKTGNFGSGGLEDKQATVSGKFENATPSASPKEK